jgi:hypothetical protein
MMTRKKKEQPHIFAGIKIDVLWSTSGVGLAQQHLEMFNSFGFMPCMDIFWNIFTAGMKLEKHSIGVIIIITLLHWCHSL